LIELSGRYLQKAWLGLPSKKNKTPVISRSFQSSIKKRTVNQTVVCGKVPNIRFFGIYILA